MKAVILAGGRGERLRPLTDTIPKPMTNIEGKPFLQYQMEHLKKFNIEDIVLCVGYLAESIQRYFQNGYQFGLNITYSIENTPLGTGGALKKALSEFKDDVVLLNGDTYLPIDYSSLLSFSKKTRAIGIMVIYDNKEIVMSNNVKINKDGYVSFYNKRGENTNLNAVDAGVYVFKRDLFRFFPDKDIFSLEEDVFHKIIETGELMSYSVDTRFYDIGTPERLETFRDFIKNMLLPVERI